MATRVSPPEHLVRELVGSGLSGSRVRAARFASWAWPSTAVRRRRCARPATDKKRTHRQYTAFWEADGLVLEFRTQASNVDEFTGLLDALAVVDVDSWLTALPASVIEAADHRRRTRKNVAEKR